MNTQEKIEQAFKSFSKLPTATAIDTEIEKIVNERYNSVYNADVLKFLLTTIDLTTLAGGDTEESVSQLVQVVNDRAALGGDTPNVAAICVYPLQVAVVKRLLKAKGVKIAAVSGGFPASQTFLEIKLAETALTVSKGADEIDIVLNLNDFLSHNYPQVVEEIEEQKAACRGAHLKVILESGLLKEPEAIQKASILSLYSGADFIKTSTGKEYPGADLRAAYVMCSTLKEYYQATGKRCGVKFSGGIRSAEEALKYYCIVEAILGKEWLTNELFRIGTSSLLNNLLKAIETL